MTVQYKCPKAECPPTDFRPAPVTSFGDEVRMAVCAGQCGDTYPENAFKTVQAK